jgi:hypothetical protein
MVAVVVLLSVGWPSLAVLTALGARERGAAMPVAVVAGLFFPVSWVAWYVRDEYPHRRAAG